MKLFIQKLGSVAGLKDLPSSSKDSLVLVTEEGELLRGQVSSSLVSDSPGAIPKFSVTFLVYEGGVILDLDRGF